MAGIESNPQNFTRFFVVTRPDRAGPTRPVRRSPASARPASCSASATARAACTSALAAFAEQQVDLTKIESRPIPGRPWEYFFYLDFLGDPAEPAVARALERLTRSGRERARAGLLPPGRDAGPRHHRRDAVIRRA